ncbi:hypothetical protein EDC04DRAFT_2611672 [Pisolithus marmoratus]|nr:hypothetical protein EDC04DRAFT_2611672 [Pisolithus marmoratus]
MSCLGGLFAGCTVVLASREAEGLFADDPSVWPQSLSHFYLGSVPTVSTLPCACHFPLLVWKVVNFWHEQCILLAGRIWGEYKHAGNQHRLVPVDSLDLLHHLHYLLSS